MKITKNYLKQIIKEEMQKVLNENLQDLSRLKSLLEKFEISLNVFIPNKNYFLGIKATDRKKMQEAGTSFQQMNELFKKIFEFRQIIQQEINKSDDENLKNLNENISNIQSWINSCVFAAENTQAPNAHRVTDPQTIKELVQAVNDALTNIEDYLQDHGNKLTVGSI